MAIHLGGSSRQSLVATSAALEAELKGVSADAAALLSNELFAVVNVLGANVALRRAITDPARSAEDKAKLLGDIFLGKLGKNAMDIAVKAVSLRWSAPSDLLISLEQVAIQAEASAANSRGELDQLEDELFIFARALVANQELRNALNGNSDAIAEKQTLVNSVLKTSTKSTKALVAQIVNGLWGRNIETALADLAHGTANFRNLVVAHVRTAIELSDKQKSELTKALSKEVGQNVRINIEIDPRVLGGISIRFRDELIDGTVISRMAEASQVLAGK